MNAKTMLYLQGWAFIFTGFLLLLTTNWATPESLGYPILIGGIFIGGIAIIALTSGVTNKPQCRICNLPLGDLCHRCDSHNGA